MPHDLLPAGEDPGQREEPVGQRVHQGGAGVGQKGLEVPSVEAAPLLSHPGLVRLVHVGTQALRTGLSS